MKASQQKVTAKNPQGKEVSCTGFFRDVVYIATLWTQKKYTGIQFYEQVDKNWRKKEN